MRIGIYSFRPGLLPTLVTLLLFPVLLGLGFWQLDRAEQKRDWQASLEQGRQAPALNLNAAQPIYANSQHRQAQATGHYDGGHQFLLDNQLQQGRVGYRILTPLRLQGSEQAVLVERGWVAASPDRQQLPAIAIAEAEPVTVTGRIDLGPSVGLRLGEPGETGRWPARIQYVDFDYLQEQLPYPLLPYMLRPDETAGGPASGHMPPERHVGYAVQWFALAATLVAFYLGVNTKRQRSAE